MKLKKVIALIMTAALSLSVLAGCGGKESQESSAGNDTPSTEEESPSASEKEESAPDSAETENESGEAEEASGAVTFPLAETMTFTAFAGMNGDYTLTDNIAMQKSLADANIKLEGSSAWNR